MVGRQAAEGLEAALRPLPAGERASPASSPRATCARGNLARGRRRGRGATVVSQVHQHLRTVARKRAGSRGDAPLPALPSSCFPFPSPRIPYEKASSSRATWVMTVASFRPTCPAAWSSNLVPLFLCERARRRADGNDWSDRGRGQSRPAALRCRPAGGRIAWSAANRRRSLATRCPAFAKPLLAFAGS